MISGMIPFRRREDALPSALILLSAALLTATLIYMLAVPRPSAAALDRGHTRARRQVLRETADVRKRTRQAQAAVAPRLWPGDANAASSGVLALLTVQTRRHALKLGAFRPQRPQALAGLTELPFSVQVSGPYPRVQAVMAALDAPQSRLALRSVEVASSEETSDVVTATLGLSAYMASGPALMPPAAPAPPKEPVKKQPIKPPVRKGAGRA
ncbi:MAG: hypothetical protein JO250_17405 [Armatimonadetes bacterium]|nr:hypothetical protein [Armatimonadota bacterium]